jgi:hypothetical protein
MSHSDAASSEPRTDPEMSSNEPSMDEDGEYFDCSLCGVDEGDDDYEQFMPLPGKESHTTDMEQFEFYLNKVKAMPRMAYEGDTPFNTVFWDYIRGVLECGKPLGFTDLPDREQCMPKGASDNGAMISKIMNTFPINPLYPNVVADLSGVPIAEVLTELLYAVKVGMLTMRWTPVCDRCYSATCVKRSLQKFPALAYCSACRYTNTIDMLQKIKVIFIFNTDIFYFLAEVLACKPSTKSMSVTKIYAMTPATFSGSGFRWSVGCDGDLMLRPPFPPGKYRMRCPIALVDSWFVVEREATEDDEPIDLPIHVSDLVYRGGELKTTTVLHGKVRFHCYCDTHSFFILWVMQNLDPKTLLYLPPDERAPMTDAMTVMQHPTYKILLEGTDREADLFAGAVQRMMMTELAKESELK